MIIITLALVFITPFITAFIAPVLGLLHVCGIMWYEFTRCFFSGRKMILIFYVDVILCLSSGVISSLL
jgi:hypothetical protein